MRTVVVVGMSLAGVRTVEALRHEGFDGRIVAIGAESHLPYDRPPLSKAVLRGEADSADVVLRHQGYEDLDLDWRLGRSATSLDLADRTVVLDGGERVGFDGLVIATGATARTMPGAPDLPGLTVLQIGRAHV